MKSRARRVTIGVAVLGTVLAAVVAVANWDTVWEHSEAWWFQLTRQTKSIPAEGGGTTIHSFPGGELILRLAARQLQCKVIFDPREAGPLLPRCTVRLWHGNNIQALLEMRGYRALVQRFPERAYVLIRSSHPTELLPLPKQELLLEGLDLVASRIEAHGHSGTP